MNISLYTSSLTLRLPVVILIILISACSDNSQNPEDRIRQYIETGKQAVENRDTGALSDLIAKKYIDDRKLNKSSLIKIARGYFLRHKNIHLFTRIDSISLADQTDGSKRAGVVVYVAMAGQPVTSLQALSGIHARLYRFDLILLQENDDWLLLTANWKRVKINEFFGE